MAYNFNMDEVLRLAEQIERNGAQFYSRAAEKAAGAPLAEFFSQLAAMEKEHEKVFASMREKLPAQDREAMTFDPQEETPQYLEALANVSVLDDRAKKAFAAAEGLSGEEGMVGVLRAAIDLEKDSVVFYLGLKELVPRHLGQDKMDEIIREEMSHIRILGGRLSSLRK